MSAVHPEVVVPHGSGGVRSFIRHQPVVVITIAVLLILGGIIYAFKFGQPTPVGPNDHAFYTTDDGTTFFTAMSKTPPFTQDGKEAVQAVVFSCDGGITKFVGYLRRYTHEGKSAAEAHKPIPIGGSEIKLPGQAEWIPEVDPVSLQSPDQVQQYASAIAKSMALKTDVATPPGVHGVPMIQIAK